MLIPLIELGHNASSVPWGWVGKSGVGSWEQYGLFELVRFCSVFLRHWKTLLNCLLQQLMNQRDYIISKASSTARESWWLLSTGIMEKNEKRLGIHNETKGGHLSPRAGQPFTRHKWKSLWKWSGRWWPTVLVATLIFSRERKLWHCLFPSVHKGRIIETSSAVVLAMPFVLTGVMFRDPVQFGTLNVPEAWTS